MKKQGQVGNIGRKTKAGENVFKGSRIEGKKGAVKKSKDKKEERKDGRS